MDEPQAGTTSNDPEVRTCLVWDPESMHHIRAYLPPLEKVELPKVGTKSALVRWLYALGYTVLEIHRGLGLKYQMVRNITHTSPKRAAREDMPSLVVRYKPETDEIQDALDGALEKSLLEGRKERLKGEARENDGN